MGGVVAVVYQDLCGVVSLWLSDIMTTLNRKSIKKCATKFNVLKVQTNLQFLVFRLYFL